MSVSNQSQSNDRSIIVSKSAENPALQVKAPQLPVKTEFSYEQERVTKPEKEKDNNS